MTIEQQIETLTREQLIAALTQGASDAVLRFLVTDAAMKPIRSLFLKTFGKCDHGACYNLALYSGNAQRGGRPLRCHEHRASSDEAVAFAAQFEAIARGMKFAA